MKEHSNSRWWLIYTINDWLIALSNYHAVDAVYFDFAKAFNSVSHTKLLLMVSLAICSIV